MKYGITKFKRYIPTIEGMKVLASYDLYSIIEITEEALTQFPSDLYFEEISELEGTICWKFYGEVRGYRKAYSDAEGLEPDADELAKGNRKTKIYMTEEISAGVIQLMKRVFKRHIIDEFNTRENREDEDQLLTDIDVINNLKDMAIKREKLIGIEMPKLVAQELSLWDDENNRRKENVDYSKGF